MTDSLEFCSRVPWQPFKLKFFTIDFRIRASDFKFHKSEVPTELLYVYIDIYLFVKWKHIERPHKHIDLSHCWLNIVSLSVILAQH